VSVSDGFDMNAYREVFLSESAEYLQGVVDALLTLESDPEDLEPVEAVFRAAHSLKGMSGTMGYERTASLTHTMESLMDTVRKREQPVTGDLIDLVLRATDALRELINDEASGGSAIDPELMVQELREHTDLARKPAQQAAEPAAAAPAAGRSRVRPPEASSSTARPRSVAAALSDGAADASATSSKLSSSTISAPLITASSAWSIVSASTSTSRSGWVERALAIAAPMPPAARM